MAGTKAACQAAAASIGDAGEEAATTMNEITEADSLVIRGRGRAMTLWPRSLLAGRRRGDAIYSKPCRRQAASTMIEKLHISAFMLVLKRWPGMAHVI